MRTPRLTLDKSGEVSLGLVARSRRPDTASLVG